MTERGLKNINVFYSTFTNVFFIFLTFFIFSGTFFTSMVLMGWINSGPTFIRRTRCHVDANGVPGVFHWGARPKCQRPTAGVGGSWGKAATRSPPARRSGGAPPAGFGPEARPPKGFPTIFITQDGLSRHYNIVNCGPSCSHWGGGNTPRGHPFRTPLADAHLIANLQWLAVSTSSRWLQYVLFYDYGLRTTPSLSSSINLRQRFTRSATSLRSQPIQTKWSTSFLIFGVFLDIYAYTLCRITTKSDVVTPIGRGLFLKGQPPPTVVKVRGPGGSVPLLRFEPHAIVWAPLIESIKCYFMPK